MAKKITFTITLLLSILFLSPPSPYLFLVFRIFVPRGVSEVCGFAVRGDFLCGFSAFPKFWCGFSVPNISAARGFVHFCTVFRSLPNFCKVFTEILSGFSVPGTLLTPPPPSFLPHPRTGWVCDDNQAITLSRWSMALGFHSDHSKILMISTIKSLIEISVIVIL